MYRIFIFLYPLSVRVAALWNPKARLWVSGRKNLIPQIEVRLAGDSRPVVWFHCASLGEFEQGRPIMEEVKRQFPDICLLLTFFSPSGYEAGKGYTGADHVFYLPMDAPGAARRFLEAVKPTLAIFIKYEFWHYYLDGLRRDQVPTLLASAAFRSNQPFFRWYGGFWRRMLGAFSYFFVQDEESLALLQGLGLGDKAMISGDTRFDRVLEIAHTGKGIPAAAAFAGNGPVIVAGSTWDEDEKELAHFVRTHPEVHFIIAPHEISKDHIQAIRQRFPGCVLFSEYSQAFPADPGAHCLIIDNIGMLSRLYQYGTITYVGGGFGGDGVHNVLEAAVWGKPVVYGPIYDKYREAIELLEAGGGFSATSTLDLEKCLKELLEKPGAIASAGEASRRYVTHKAGATDRIVKYIKDQYLPENRPS
jgi:3-deoxy-D-manno-octulosonic-acid transferase